MTNTIRTFVAIELPNEVKGSLARLIAVLRQADIRGLRTVRPEGIHLTLKFLGDIPEARVDAIVESVANAARSHHSFELEVGGVGAFPNRDRPRVLWAGVIGNMPPLNALQSDVDEALYGVGFKKENRNFSPHLTIARLREGTPKQSMQKALDALDSAGIEIGLKIPVESVSFMRTTLHADGSIHDCLASMPLNRDSGNAKNE